MQLSGNNNTTVTLSSNVVQHGKKATMWYLVGAYKSFLKVFFLCTYTVRLYN